MAAPLGANAARVLFPTPLLTPASTNYNIQRAHIGRLSDESVHIFCMHSTAKLFSHECYFEDYTEF